MKNYFTGIKQWIGFMVAVGVIAVSYAAISHVNSGDSLTVAKWNELVDAVNTTTADTYSTSEIATNKKWINGKTIYRKVIDWGVLKNTATSTIPHGITGIDWVVTIYGSTYSSSQDFRFPLPFSSSSQIYLWADSTNIKIQTTMDRTSFTQTQIIIEYTKL